MLRLKRTTSRRSGTHSRRWSSEKNLSENRQQFHLLQRLKRLLLVAMLLASTTMVGCLRSKMIRELLNLIGSALFLILVGILIEVLDRLLLNMSRRWSRNSSLDE